jgi:hypothetical protein
VFGDGPIFPICIHKKEIGLTIVDRALAYQSLIMCVVHDDNKQIFKNICMRKKEKTNLTDGKSGV